MPQDFSEKTKKSWLGKGVAFPFSPIALDKDKKIVDFSSTELVKFVDLARAEYEESVRQSINIILGTAKGERVMRPDFGCGIYDLVFETNTPSTASKISQVVQEALLLFEPRIDVLNIRVESQFDSDGAKLLINIDYQVRATNNVFNLVYPFYLERSPG